MDLPPGAMDWLLDHHEFGSSDANLPMSSSAKEARRGNDGRHLTPHYFQRPPEFELTSRTKARLDAMGATGGWQQCKLREFQVMLGFLNPQRSPREVVQLGRRHRLFETKVIIRVSGLLRTN